MVPSGGAGGKLPALEEIDGEAALGKIKSNGGAGAAAADDYDVEWGVHGRFVPFSSVSINRASRTRPAAADRLLPKLFVS
jgi:hypothetical protein